MRFPGPKGLTQEIFTTAKTAVAPLNIRRSPFVTGACGMGHVAITSTKPATMHGYYGTVFDARLSDFIEETISGVKFKIRFLRLNERHHSVAIAAAQKLPIDPIRTRVQHLNIQTAELDDMVDSYQRVTALGFGMALGIGQHTNDRELSFYAVTPSGFEWEVGWNPILIDETTWEPTTHQGISIWGHTRRGRLSSTSSLSSKSAFSHCATANGPCPPCRVRVAELAGPADQSDDRKLAVRLLLIFGEKS